MRRTGPARWAIYSLATLLVSTVAFGAIAALSGPSAPPSTKQEAVRGENEATATHTVVADRIVGFDPWTPVDLAREPWRAPEDGTPSTPEDALKYPHQWSRFIAIGDEGLDRLRAEGHFTGNGTAADPYVIERFRVTHEMVIQSTHRAVVIRDGHVEGQLRLNYIGPLVHVHHVYAEDLRVNENVRRSGDNTGGLFHDNRFDFVGQIRHFTGTFFDNVVGPRPKSAVSSALGDSGMVRIRQDVVFNFDGFHGADVHHNVFHGMVDIKLHGHNHADCFTCTIHDHADPGGYPADQEGYDAANASNGHRHEIPPEHQALGLQSHHSVRYHSLLFRDNQIEVPRGIALRYHDTAHAADDQTANSEPNEYLEDPHVHYQDITFARNRLSGGGFVLELFNAPDERHVLSDVGALRLLENQVTIHYKANERGPIQGMDLGGAKGLELLVSGNTVRFEESKDASALGLVPRLGGELVLNGFRLNVIRSGNLTFAANTVTTGLHGVFAQSLVPTVYWELLGNDFRTTHDYKGQRVETPPYESDDPDGTQRERAHHDEAVTQDTSGADPGHDDHAHHGGP